MREGSRPIFLLIALVIFPSVVLSSENFTLKILDGEVENVFFRKNADSAHVALSSGNDARIIVAFPTENSAVGLWFKPSLNKVTLKLKGSVTSKQEKNGFWGVKYAVKTSTHEIPIEEIILGSVRHLRDYELLKTKPPEIKEKIEIKNDGILRASRPTLNGKYEFRLDLRGTNGTQIRSENGRWSLIQTGQGFVEFEMTALTSEIPLTPIPQRELLKPNASSRVNSTLVTLLSFLSYKEKFLAGSWRYLTYFGRDTLMSIELLMQVLQPEAIEAALGGCLERLSPEGQVAHEEDIGDFATYEHLKNGEKNNDFPIYDYKMIDGDFLLPLVVRDYLQSVPKNRVQSFLKRKTKDGIEYSTQLKKNLDFIVGQAKNFATDPKVENLVSLKRNQNVGEWRDSNMGLGGGRYPFDVNVALVPSALQAASQLFALGLGTADDSRLAFKYFQRWKEKAPKFFHVVFHGQEAQKKTEGYLKGLGLKSPLQSRSDDIEFNPVALDQEGKPISIMNSDDGFLLLFSEPDPSELSTIADHVIDPFPYGLRTPVGIFVSNPAFADEKLWKSFTKNDYHGTVVWSWQQALLAAGLNRQLKRNDLSKDLRAKLKVAHRLLWDVITRTSRYKSSELWSWKVENDQMKATPYGQDPNHLMPSNPAQLWSLVYLGVQPEL